MKTYIILSLFAFGLLTACETEKVETNLSKEIIVESYIQPGDSIGMQLKHLLQYYGTDTVAKTLDNCSVSVYVNQKPYALAFRDTGCYALIDSTLKIKENDSISMVFQFGELQIAANTVIPTKPVNFIASSYSISVPDFSSGMPGSGGGERPSMESLSLSWTNSDNSYYMIAVQPVSANPVAINESDTISDNRRRMFRNEPSASSSYNIPPMEFRYKGLHRIILYHLNPEYATLYKFSGNTSLNISEPPTNIKNGFGIFTGMNSDTLYVSVSVE